MPFVRVTKYKRKTAARRRAMSKRYALRARRPLVRRRGLMGPSAISTRLSRPIGLNGGPLPLRFYTRFRYSERFNINNSGAPSQLASIRLNLNSLFDPNSSGIGHQPRGYDQLCPTFYQKYRVFGCKVRVEPHVTSTGAFGGRMLFGWQALSGSTSEVSTQTEARECIGTRVWTVSNNTKPPVFSKYYDCATTAGFPKASYRADDETEADYNQNPVQLSRLHVFVGSPDDTMAVSAVLNVEMTFYCVLFQRDVLPES